MNEKAHRTLQFSWDKWIQWRWRWWWRRCCRRLHPYYQYNQNSGKVYRHIPDKYPLLTVDSLFFSAHIQKEVETSHLHSHDVFMIRSFSLCASVCLQTIFRLKCFLFYTICFVWLGVEIYKLDFRYPSFIQIHRIESRIYLSVCIFPKKKCEMIEKDEQTRIQMKKYEKLKLKLIFYSSHRYWFIQLALYIWILWIEQLKNKLKLKNWNSNILYIARRI